MNSLIYLFQKDLKPRCESLHTNAENSYLYNLKGTMS